MRAEHIDDLKPSSKARIAPWTTMSIRNEGENTILHAHDIVNEDGWRFTMKQEAKAGAT